jgi:hypothetical protein
MAVKGTATGNRPLLGVRPLIIGTVALSAVH